MPTPIAVGRQGHRRAPLVHVRSVRAVAVGRLRARALQRLVRQVRRAEGEAGVHRAGGEPRLPVRPGAGRDHVAVVPLRGHRRGLRACRHRGRPASGWSSSPSCTCSCSSSRRCNGSRSSSRTCSASVGFVDNPQGSDSRLQTLTIDEYQARRFTHRIAQQVVVGEIPAGSWRRHWRRSRSGASSRSGPRGRPLTCPPSGHARPARPARGPVRLTSARRSGRSGTPARCWRGSPPGSASGAAQHPNPWPVRQADRRTPRRGPPVGSRVGGGRVRAAARGVQAGRRPGLRREYRAAPGWTATTKPGRCSRSAPMSVA